jgi:hypothetical protein
MKRAPYVVAPTPTSSTHNTNLLWGFCVCGEINADTQTDVPEGGPSGAICVQGFDDSLNSAIHTTYRISLRSSSLCEPRYPLLKVVFPLCDFFFISLHLSR